MLSILVIFYRWRNSHGMESLLRLKNKISDTVNERYGHGQINRFILLFTKLFCTHRRKKINRLQVNAIFVTSVCFYFVKYNIYN